MTDKLRVLFTIPNLNTAGSGLALFNLLKRLNKNKFEPHVLCLHSKGELFQKFASAGFQMHVKEYTHTMRPVAKGLKHCWEVSKWFRANGFSVIYSYHYTADYSEAIAAKLAGSKWLFVKKNMGWFGSSYNSWRLRSFLADRIVIQNKEMARVFYPKSSKATLISIGVDTKSFYKLEISPKQLFPFSVGDKTKIIGIVANFVPVKGLNILIRAFNSLYKNRDVRLVLVGDYSNEYGDDLLSLVKELGISNEYIYFAGGQKNINEWLNVFDLFVQCSTGKGEGSPIAVQEAIAAGTLVIGSRVCGVEDQLAVTPELLFEPENSVELAEKIEYVFALEKSELESLKNKQKEHLLRNYTLESEVAAVERMLAAL